MPVQFAG